MRTRTRLRRLLAGATAFVGLVGVGATVLAVPAAAAPGQASNFNVAVMSPGQDESTLSNYNQCGTSNHDNSAGYYAFPSKQSTVDNGLQTDIGNDQGMLKLTFDLPNAVDSGTITVTAPNPPRPATVPGGAPYGTVFPPAEVTDDAAAGLYNCSLPAGQSFSSLYYAVQISTGSNSTTYNFPGYVQQSSTAPNQVGIPFAFQGGASSSSVTVYIADVVNPPEGTYQGVNYTVSVDGSTQVAAPAQNSTTFVASTPDATTSTLTSSLTSSNPDLTATDVPADGAVLTATIYDAFYNPIQGDSVYIGVNGGPGGAETAPIGSTSSGGGNGEPVTTADGQAQYYAYGTEATPPGNPDTFFAQDTSAGIFVENPDGSLATVSIPIVAADPNPPSVSGSQSSVAVFGGDPTSNLETTVTADGSSSATISITLADVYGNAATNQAIVLQPIQPSPPAASENLKHVVITPQVPPTPGDACSQGPSSQIPDVSCTDGNGTTTFTVTDTLAQSVSFEITDLTDGDVLPYLYLPSDVPNIPIVDFTAGAVSTTTSTVTVDGGQSADVLADGTAQATVDVTLLDSEANPEVGRQVSLAGSTATSSVVTATTPPAEASTLAAQGCSLPAPGTTDCDGNAYFTVSDTTVEAVTYTAIDETDGVTLTGAGRQPVVSFVTGTVSAGSSTVSAEPPTVVGDGQGVSTVSVKVLDDGGHALDGETVTLDVPTGDDAITVVPQSATSDASGTATLAVRSASPIGHVSLPVTVGQTQLTSTADIDFVNAPSLANTTVTAGPADPEATGTADETVTVVAEAANGAPIQGLSVELLGGSVPSSPPTTTTDASGTATFEVGADLPSPPAVTYTAVDLSDDDRTLGTATVTYVPVPDEAHESTVTAAPASTYTFVAGQPAAQQSSTVTVTLKDPTGKAIQGDTVDLAASSASAVVTPVAGGVSDANGVAAFTVTDPDPEKVTFTATDATTGTTLVETAVVSFVLRPDEDSTSTVTASPATVEADGTSAAKVTVTLQNNGVLLAGDTVSLSQGQGESIISTGDPVSNAAGQVTFEVADLTAQAVSYEATDLTTATELDEAATVTFTAPPGGSLRPVVTAISPSSGSGSGGTQVTITGTDLAGATAVDFGTQLAPTFTTSPTGTEIVATSPIPIAAGAVDVTVTSPGGTSVTGPADIFTYDTAPPVTIAEVSPVSGPVDGGTLVTLTGTGLASGVKSVSFGGRAATVLHQTGRTVTVQAPAAQSPGRVDVVVSAGDETSKAQPMDVFAFVGAPRPQPAILKLTPASGSVRGGTAVTLHGDDLTGASKVEFGGTAGTDLAVAPGGSSLTVRSPAASHAGMVRVTVLTAGGASPAVTADHFTYLTPRPEYHALSKAVRVVDTAVTGGGGALGAGATRTVEVAGTAGVPATATSVCVQVTLGAGHAPTALTLYRAGGTRPATAQLTAAAGRSVTRTITVTVGTDGRISFHSKAASTNAVITVEGYDVLTTSTSTSAASGRSAGLRPTESETPS